MSQSASSLSQRVRNYFSAMSTWPLEERLVQPDEPKCVSFALRMSSWGPGIALYVTVCLGMFLSDTSIDALYSYLAPETYLRQFWNYGVAAHAEFNKGGDFAFARRFATTAWLGIVTFTSVACILATTLSVITFCVGTTPSRLDGRRFFAISIGVALWCIFMTALFWGDVDVYGITDTDFSKKYSRDASSFLLLAVGPSTLMLIVAPWVLYATKLMLVLQRRRNNSLQKSAES